MRQVATNCDSPPMKEVIELKQKQKKVLQCLLSSSTQKQAARLAGVSENTITAYLKNPEFQKAYQAALNAMIEDSNRQLKQTLSPAITTLTDIMQNEDESAASRITASRTLLEYSLRFSELSDVLARITSLEEKYSELSGGDEYV